MVPEIGIIGFGNLGIALARMCVKSNAHVLAGVRAPKNLQDYQAVSDNVDFTHNNKEVAQCPTIILCVKPSAVQDVCVEISDTITETTVVICTAAVVSLAKLSEWLPRCRRIIRCMPNIACQVHKGIVPYYSTWEDAVVSMDAVFGTNMLMAVNSDAAVDLATVISGCGPAFFAWFVTQLSCPGNTSLTPEQKTILIGATMRGTAKLLDLGEPDLIIKAVASKGGVTEAALNRLQEKKVDAELRDVLDCANQRIHTLVHQIQPEAECEACAVATLPSSTRITLL